MKALVAYIVIAIFFLPFVAHANVLPDCPINEDTRWDNCTGTFTYMSGDKYVGEFRDDKMHGPGTFTWANGNRHLCIYINGIQQGPGTFIRADGAQYTGEHRDGKPHSGRLHDMTKQINEKKGGIKQ